MKKIDLVTGFLGSGKTTFIKEYADYLVRCGEKVAIIVNDYGAINVDRLLLGSSLGDKCHLEMVIGGDKDCTRRRLKTKLISMAMQDYTHVILEPSGIFDVDDFLDMLYEEPLDRWYEMGCIISIVEADIDKSMSDAARYIMISELSKAGIIILSKIEEVYDQLDESKKSEMESIIKKECLDFINEGLEDFKCSRRFDNLYIWNEGSITDEDFQKISRSGYTSTDMINLHSVEDSFDSAFFFHVETDLESLEETLEGIFNDREAGSIVRIKGFIRSNDAWLQVNATRHGVRINPSPEGQELFIVIGENLDKEIIGKHWKSYRNGL